MGPNSRSFCKVFKKVKNGISKSGAHYRIGADPDLKKSEKTLFLGSISKSAFFGVFEHFAKTRKKGRRAGFEGITRISHMFPYGQERPIFGPLPGGLFLPPPQGISKTQKVDFSVFDRF